MKNAIKRAAGLLMTTVLLATALLPAGCTRRAKDEEAIKETTQQFIDAFPTGDSKEIEGLIDGDFAFDVKDRDRAELVFRAASKTEIIEYKNIEIDRQTKTARARIQIKYVDFMELTPGILDTYYLSKEDYLKKIDNNEGLSTTNLTLRYYYDKDLDRWLIDDASAEKYEHLFNDAFWITMAKLSVKDAKDAFESLIPGLAGGEFEQDYYTFYLENAMIFGDGGSDDPAVREAATEFVKAYYLYVVDHGVEVKIDDGITPYQAAVTGYVPSREEIFDYLNSDEYVIEWYMAYTRSENVSDINSYNEIWNQFYAGIYYDLAKRIPDMKWDNYAVNFSINPISEDPKIDCEWYIFPLTVDSVYSASKITDEQELRCRQKAVEALYYAGELTEAQYKAYMEEIEKDRNSASDPSSGNGYTVTEQDVNWAGTNTHPNQAVGVYEYLPDWSDGTLIYGASALDSNGIYMHYSKEPGWLHTAGYNVGDDGITVMLKYDHVFLKDTELVYDWYIDGEQYGESVSIFVDESGTTEFEFTLPDHEISRYSTCELRLWEKNHTHVIAYVKLTKT